MSNLRKLRDRFDKSHNFLDLMQFVHDADLVVKESEVKCKDNPVLFIAEAIQAMNQARCVAHHIYVNLAVIKAFRGVTQKKLWNWPEADIYTLPETEDPFDPQYWKDNPRYIPLCEHISDAGWHLPIGELDEYQRKCKYFEHPDNINGCIFEWAIMKSHVDILGVRVSSMFHMDDSDRVLNQNFNCQAKAYVLAEPAYSKCALIVESSDWRE